MHIVRGLQSSGLILEHQVTASLSAFVLRELKEFVFLTFCRLGIYDLLCTLWHFDWEHKH